ncbi:MAG: ATP-binding protein [Muribaculaceae bacterium]|nr:ATP-binding protein [Muribaculaceae bacterium]
MGHDKDYSLKVAAGYIAVMLLFGAAIAFVWLSMRSIVENSNDERRLERSGLVTRRLLAEALRTEAAAQIAISGTAEALDAYEDAYRSFVAGVDSLKSMYPDSSLMHNDLDSILVISDKKHEIVRQLALASNSNDYFADFQRTINELVAARDSLASNTTVREILKEEREITVRHQEKNFFKRLGKVFSPGTPDTALISSRIQVAHTDTTNSSIADGLSEEIRMANNKASNSRLVQARSTQNNIRRLHSMNTALSARINLLLTRVQNAEIEHASLIQESIARSTHELLLIICIIATMAIIFAAIFYTMVRRDVRKAAEYRRSIEESNEQITRLMNERESMLLTITHDLKSPAASVKGYAKALSHTALDDYQRMCAHSVYRSADRLLTLAGSLLDYHRIEAGEAVTIASDFIPALLLRDIYNTFAPLAAEKGLTLTLDTDTSCSTPVNADADRILAIIDNLTGNAIKYTASGTVSISAHVENGMLTVSVADTGCGISPLDQARIFNRFTRTEECMGIEGSGIGLSIVSAMARLIGADITLQSQPGKGSTFTLSVKVDAPTESFSPEGFEADTIKELPVVTNGLNILIVDDDALQRRLVRMALDRIGASIITIEAANATDAMQKASSSRPDIVITDIQMPHISGVELCRDLKELYPDLLVIALSAAGTELTGIDTDIFDAVLSKPLDEHDLAVILSDVCQPQEVPDLSSFLEYAGGDTDTEFEILETLRIECRQYIAQLKEANASADTQAIRSVAHRLTPILKMAALDSCDISTALDKGTGAESMSSPEYDKMINTVIRSLISIIKKVDNIIGEE